MNVVMLKTDVGEMPAADFGLGAKPRFAVLKDQSVEFDMMKHIKDFRFFKSRKDAISYIESDIDKIADAIYDESVYDMMVNRISNIR